MFGDRPYEDEDEDEVEPDDDVVDDGRLHI